MRERIYQNIHSYIAPSATLAEYQRKMSALVLNARGCWPKNISENFTAWVLEWGNWTTNEMECTLLEAFAEVDVILTNVVCILSEEGPGARKLYTGGATAGQRGTNLIVHFSSRDEVSGIGAGVSISRRLFSCVYFFIFFQ